MIDEAGNLLFTHNDNNYRIFNFNWRLQRDFLNKILPIQVPSDKNDGNTVTALVGENSAVVQDYLFSKTQIEEGSSFVNIDKDKADKLFDKYQDSVALFQKIMLEITPFLSEGGESSPQSSKSVKNQSNTVNKPSGTLKT